MLQEEIAVQAIAALLKHESGPKKGKKAQLFDAVDEKVLSMVVGMKIFPKKERTKPYPIGIPHSLHSGSEICLIVKDPQRSMKDRLEKEPIEGIVKVIGLTKLRDNYKTFEAKRNLCDSYDLFMIDRRILPMASKLLGNSFFRKKKQPVPIEIAKSNTGLRINIARARDSTQLFLGDGPCSMVKFAHTGMEQEEIVANLMAAAAGVAHRIPGKWTNIQAIHIKTHDSVALPVFNSMPMGPAEATEPVADDSAAAPGENVADTKNKSKKSSKKRRLADEGEEKPSKAKAAPKPASKKKKVAQKKKKSAA